MNEAQASASLDGETRCVEPRDIPVLLKGPLVRKFLADPKVETPKTVTRRLDLKKWRRYRPGDRIYFKETWQAIHVSIDPETGYGDDYWHAEKIPKSNEGRWWEVQYAADPGHEKHKEDRGFPWRPSIYMPKWAARCWAIIEDIREEPLQDITEEDAIAEGIEAHDDEGVTYYGPLDRGHADPRQAFRSLWDSINTKPGQRWADNPTVARIQFRRIEVPRG